MSTIWSPGATSSSASRTSSDTDLVLVVATSAEPFERRAARWDVTRLPVPAGLLVYTLHEWRTVVAGHPRRLPLGEVRWVVNRGLE
jgi:hypothetical protein